jgi:hypothetical protein
MAPRARPPSPELLDPPAMSPDRLVQLFVVALLDQVGDNLQHTPYATVEGKLRAARSRPPRVAKEKDVGAWRRILVFAPG